MNTESPLTLQKYPAASIKDMTAIPVEGGVRDRFLAEFPAILHALPVVELSMEAHAEAAHARLPWYKRWLPKKAIHKALVSQLYNKCTWTDDDLSTVTLTLHETDDKSQPPIFHRRLPLASFDPPVFSLIYVQLEGTEDGEAGDVFWSGAFDGEHGGSLDSILREAEEIEAMESGSFQPGRVFRAYGPFTATKPTAEKHFVRETAI